MSGDRLLRLVDALTSLKTEGGVAWEVDPSGTKKLELISEIERMTDLLQRTEARNSKLVEALQMSEEDRNTIESECQTLIARTERDNDRLTSKVGEKAGELAEMSDKYETAMVKVGTLINERNKLNNAVKHIDRTNEDLSTGCQTLKDELAHIQAHLQQSTERLKYQEETNTQLQKELESIREWQRILLYRVNASVRRHVGGIQNSDPLVSLDDACSSVSVREGVCASVREGVCEGLSSLENQLTVSQGAASSLRALLARSWGPSGGQTCGRNSSLLESLNISRLQRDSQVHSTETSKRDVKRLKSCNSCPNLRNIPVARSLLKAACTQTDLSGEDLPPDLSGRESGAKNTPDSSATSGLGLDTSLSSTNSDLAGHRTLDVTVQADGQAGCNSTLDTPDNLVKHRRHSFRTAIYRSRTRELSSSLDGENSSTESSPESDAFLIEDHVTAREDGSLVTADPVFCAFPGSNNMTVFDRYVSSPGEPKAPLNKPPLFSPPVCQPLPSTD